MLLQILEIPSSQHTPSHGNIPALIFYSHKEYMHDLEITIMVGL